METDPANDRLRHRGGIDTAVIDRLEQRDRPSRPPGEEIERRRGHDRWGPGQQADGRSGDRRIAPPLESRQRRRPDAFVARRGGDSEQHRLGRRRERLAENREVGEPILRLGIGVSHHRERIGHGRPVGQPQPQGPRATASPADRGEELGRDRSERPAGKGLLAALEEAGPVERGGGRGDEPGRGQLIVARSEGEPAGHARLKDVAPEPGIPQWSALPSQPGEGRRPFLGEEPLDGPPDQQRNVDVIAVGGRRFGITGEKRGDEGERLIGGETAGRGGQLATHPEVGLGACRRLEAGKQGGRDATVVASQPDGPRPHPRIGVPKQGNPFLLARGPEADQRPGKIEWEGGWPGGRAEEEPGNPVAGPRWLSVGQFEEGRLTNPAIGIGKPFHEGLAAVAGEVGEPGRGGGRSREPPDAPPIPVDPPLIVAGMVDALLVEVADIEGPIGTELDVDRTKPAVIAGQGNVEILGGEARAIGADGTADHLPLERGHAEQAPGVLVAERRGVVDGEGMGESRSAVVTDRLEEAEGERGRQLPVLLEPLPREAPLHVVKSTGIAAVVAREQPAGSVELNPEGIPSPLGEDLVAPRRRVVAPDALPGRNDRRSIRPGATDAAGDRAPLGGVEPAIGPPAEIVGDRVGILDAEALQMDDRIAVGLIVPVGVGIEEEVRRLENPQTGGIEREARDEAQSIDKNTMFFGDPVAVGILVERDPIETAVMVGRGGRHLVVDASQEGVAADHRQPRRLRVLDELGHPDPAPGIPLHREWLTDRRFGEDQIDAEILRHPKPAPLVGGGEWPRVVDPAERRLDFRRRFDPRLQERRRLAGNDLPPPEHPPAGEAEGFIPREKHRCRHVEPGPSVPQAGPDDDLSRLSGRQEPGRDPEPVGPPQTAAEPGRKLPCTPDGLAVGNHFERRVERLDEQFQRPSFPRRRHDHATAIPPDSIQAPFRLPEHLRHRHRLVGPGVDVVSPHPPRHDKDPQPSEGGGDRQTAAQAAWTGGHHRSVSPHVPVIHPLPRGISKGILSVSEPFLPPARSLPTRRKSLYRHKYRQCRQYRQSTSS